MIVLRVLVDVSAGDAIVEWLRESGHDVAAVRDRDGRMEDSDILAWAVQETRLVITMDKDFGELVYHSGLEHSGVLLFRLEAAPRAKKLQVMKEVLEAHANQIGSGFAVYQNGRLRIRA